MSKKILYELAGSPVCLIFEIRTLGTKRPQGNKISVSNQDPLFIKDFCHRVSKQSKENED